MKILIIQTAFIGDVILATAVIEKLAQHYPGAEIDFLLRKGNESLLLNNPHISEVLIWNKKQAKFRNLLQIIHKVRSNKYDYIINLHRFITSGLVTTCSGARHKIGFNKNPLSLFFTKKVKHIISSSNENDLHEVDRNNLLVASLTDEKRIKPKLYPSDADIEKIKSLQQQPYICLAPASVWFTKQWAVEKWIELLNNLNPAIKVYLLGAGNDSELCNKIIHSSVHKATENLCGRLSFLESAALMKGAMMNYVNDSAPLHIASAVNAPVTAIYCSTMPYFGFGPLSDISFVIETKEKLACRPCGLHGHKACPQGHFKCSSGISINEVIKTLTVK
ncbi:MAG TPA: glycosyltransferase family 9 protein [Chitinophagaceae bacterium]|nr:glycosyltransferase family 9 protein [Chitinophagaceae bacterium]